MTPTQTHYRPFKRVLIANRGEIALRIIRACRENNLETVTLYSEADEFNRHRFESDYSIPLKGRTSAETYLKIPTILQALKTSGADAVHPGYGFLSENKEFAEAIRQSGAVFIGPPPEAMGLMGHKVAARNLMTQCGVPVVPGAKKPLETYREFEELMDSIGFPLILKAAGGGGGKGMKIVRSKEDAKTAYETCKREALSYFGLEDVFAERYIEHPRHVEVQVLFDSHGNGVHLWERDCTIQRRHQKLVEEAPSPYLSQKMREDIGERAVRAAAAAGYVGAGTVEFICESPEKIYFMEMNTRIQVEHPVTESITGIDLIEAQLKVAAGEKLPYLQKDIPLNGTAIEVRINAEDPSRDFAPSPGWIQRLSFPGGPFTRVDSHLTAPYKVPEEYDSLLAKLIVWAPTREKALKRLKRALGELRIEGIMTTAPFFEQLIELEAFKEGVYTTRFIEENSHIWGKESSLDQATESKEGLLLAAAALVQSSP